MTPLQISSSVTLLPAHAGQQPRGVLRHLRLLRWCLPAQRSVGNSSRPIAATCFVRSAFIVAEGMELLAAAITVEASERGARATAVAMYTSAAADSRGHNVHGSRTASAGAIAASATTAAAPAATGKCYCAQDCCQPTNGDARGRLSSEDRPGVRRLLP